MRCGCDLPQHMHTALLYLSLQPRPPAAMWSAPFPHPPTTYLGPLSADRRQYLSAEAVEVRVDAAERLRVDEELAAAWKLRNRLGPSRDRAKVLHAVRDRNMQRREVRTRAAVSRGGVDQCKRQLGSSFRDTVTTGADFLIGAYDWVYQVLVTTQRCGRNLFIYLFIK